MKKIKNIFERFLYKHYGPEISKQEVISVNDFLDLRNEVEGESKKESEEYQKLYNRIEEARNYLMGVKPSELTVEDTLIALGFRADGLED